MNAQEPVKISNLSETASGTIVFNKGAGIQDLPSHSITFQYEVQDPFKVTMVSSLVKSTKGNFNVRDSIKWKGEAHVPSEKTTQFRVLPKFWSRRRIKWSSRQRNLLRRASAFHDAAFPPFYTCWNTEYVVLYGVFFVGNRCLAI